MTQALPFHNHNLPRGQLTSNGGEPGIKYQMQQVLEVVLASIESETGGGPQPTFGGTCVDVCFMHDPRN